MSKYRYGWWGYVKYMIRRYPDLKSEYDSLRDTKITAEITVIPGGGGVSNPTENAALRELTPQKQKEYDAVCSAIIATRMYKNGEDRLKVIRLVFWDKSHTLEGSAMQVPCSYYTACNWHREFIYLTALKYGFISAEEYNKAINRKGCL